MGKLFFFLAALAIVVFGLSFALVNVEPVAVDYYFGVTTLPLSAALAIALALGAVLGVLFSLGVVVKSRTRVLRLRRELNHARKELNELRKLPINRAA